MSARSGHFCPHGNLRYSCAKCRNERRARREPPKRKEYGAKLGPGGAVPRRHWSLQKALSDTEAAAVRSLEAKQDGVIVLPAPLGLRRVAYAVLRSLRHDGEGVLFVVPSARAVTAWSEALVTDLNVPPEEIDDTGRLVRDWRRLPVVTLWSPETLRRHAGQLQPNAQKLVLVVDSPEGEAFAGCENVMRASFARKIGLMAARFAPPERDAWPRLDALGGTIHALDVSSALRSGALRSVKHRSIVVEDDTQRATSIVEVLRASGERSRGVVWVDGTSEGRRVEEALSRAGIEARFLGGAATAGLAQRVGTAVREGPARVLVRTPDAPAVATGRLDVLVHAADEVGPAKAHGATLAAMGRGEGRLHVIDIVPRRPAGQETTSLLAERVLGHTTALGGALPQLDWLRAAGDVPPLPSAIKQRAEEAAAKGWLEVHAASADLVADGWSPAVASAALVDAYLGFRLELPLPPLGPPVPPLHVSDAAAEHVDPYAGPIPVRESLPALALHFAEAADAYAAFLRRDIAALLHVYAGAPMLHHLAPDLRRLLLSTLLAHDEARVPELDRTAPRDAALTVLARGGHLDGVEDRHGPAAVEPVQTERHMERLLAAVEAEKDHEVENSLQEIHRMGPAERQRAGRALIGLELVSKTRTDSGLELSYGLPARRGGARPELPYTELTPGALVDLSSGSRHDPLGRGTIGALQATLVRVLVAEDRERRAPGRDCRIDLVANPRIYDVLARGVRVVFGPGRIAVGASDGGLRDHLLQRTDARRSLPGQVRLFERKLDASQRAAVAHALGAPVLSLIHGPPGTGKTTTLVELIRQEVERGHRVLVSADSNAAVDAVFDAYQAAGGLGVRTGPRPSLTRSHLAPLHIDELRSRAPGVDWLRRMPVVFTTHVSSGSLPAELSFDLAIQDEASQATEPASCLGLSRAPRLVLAGDHLQLPPVVQSDGARALGLDMSLFERMHSAYGATLGNLLTVQYRMHRDVEAWSNRRFYEGRIETAVDPPPIEAAVRAGLLPASPRAVFVDVAGREEARRTSKEREAEAAWIDTRVRALLDAGVRPAQIAVIAAYRAQVRLLRQKLEDTGVDVGTIDAFQGSERDLVIVSLVRGNPRGEVGFVRDPRRLNVAVTRARRHLVVVGDAATLRGTPILDDLMETLGRLDA